MPRISDEKKQARLHRIWTIIARHSNGISEKDVHEIVHLERRTINNYLRTLEQDGKIYKGEENSTLWFPAEYQLTELRKIALSPEQAFTAYLGTRLLSKHLDRRNESAEKAMHALATVLDSTLGIDKHIESAAQQLAKRQQDDNYETIFHTVTRAYLTHHQLEIVYQPLNGNVFTTKFKTYLIEPVLIGHALYLIGYSEITNAIRSYKIERIKKATILTEKYQIEPNFDLDVLHNAWSIIFGEQTEHVVLRFEPRVASRVRETIWHPSQKISDDPDKSDYLRLTVDVAHTRDMLPWIRGWGSDVEVIAPESLRNEMIKHIYESINTYQLTSTSSSKNPALLLWGKTTQGDDYHPALYHMLDVGHVAWHLLNDDASVRWRNILAAALNADPDTLQQWLPFVVALHDIGKISIPFQAQNEKQRERLVAEGITFPRWTPALSKKLKHTMIGFLTLGELDIELPDNLNTAVKHMLAGHHGVYQEAGRRSGESRYWQMLAEPDEWHDYRHDAVGILKQVLLNRSMITFPEPTNVSAALAMLNGFTILCDWLGSDGKQFPATSYMPLDAYIAESKRRAHVAVEQAGFLHQTSSAVPADFQQMFGLAPRLLQSAIDEIAADILTHPTLTIIEAPTGEGKTEAAQYLARRIAEQTGTDEFYIALPTTATSNAMFKRVQDHLRHHLQLPSELVKLVHGQDYLVEDDLRIEPLSNGDGQTHPSLAWFVPKKQALLAPFGVGTIDQAELSVLNVKHHALRQLGLAGKVVILDEVHAYDTYMTTIIERMLTWLSSIGTSVILLSATLPTARRRQLLKAYAPDVDVSLVDDSASAPYPTVVTVNQGDCQIINPDALDERIFNIHHLDLDHDDPVTKAKWLLDQIADGGCICWITNTVDRAQRLYQAVLDCVDDDVVTDLLHGRFTQAERQLYEESILGRYGKQQDTPDRPPRGIVIGTQVLEQSLDLDFDVMVSDLAPIDLMLQRIGRLHRHYDRTNRTTNHPTPHFYVVTQINKDNEQPVIGHDKYYGEYILCRSWQAVAERMADDGTIRLPAHYRPLIEAVYNEAKPEADDPLRDYWQKYAVRQAKLHDEAKIRLINEPDPIEAFWKGRDKNSFLEDEDGNAWNVAQTRYQDRETVTVVPLEHIDEADARLLPTDSIIDLTAKADRDMQFAIMRRTIRISNQDIVEYLKQQTERPTLFEKTPILSRCYPLWLVDNQCVVNGSKQDVTITLTLDANLGLIIDKSSGV